MDSINLIKSVSPGRQKEVQVWYRISALLFIIFFVGIIIIQIKQLCRFYVVKQERMRLKKRVLSYEELIARRDTFKNQEQEFKKRIAKLTQLKENPKNPVEYLALFNKSSSQELYLDSLTLAKNILEITMVGSDIQSALHFSDSLVKTAYFSELNLVLLQPKTQQDKKVMLFTFKGKVKRT